MNARRIVFWLGLLIGLEVVLPGLPTIAQTTASKQAQPPAPGLRKLTGDDARLAEELDKAIEASLKADRWEEAIAKQEKLLGLRTRAQGPKHFETVNAEWRLKTLRRLAPMRQEDRVAYRSTWELDEQAVTLWAQGKYAEVQPLLEKALEIRRRLLTDDHPDTAQSYNDAGNNLGAQGKYAQAQLFSEKALEIRRRLLTDDHPDTAVSYRSLAISLYYQGRYAEAQPVLVRRLRLTAACSPTITPTPLLATTLLRTTSGPKGNTSRPRLCTRRRWRSGAGSLPKTTATPLSATTTWG